MYGRHGSQYMLENRAAQIGRHLRIRGVERVLRRVPLCFVDQLFRRVEPRLLPAYGGQVLPLPVNDRKKIGYGGSADPHRLCEGLMQFYDLHLIARRHPHEESPCDKP